MSTIHWVGAGIAVAEIATIQILTFDASTTYKVTIGGVEVSVLGITDVNGTAAALQAALSASSHPYFAATVIVWTVTTDTITGTAVVAGPPFEAVTSVTGGTGTIGAFTVTTARQGPNDWETPANWDAGAVPVASDDVVLANSSDNILWGIDQNAIAINSLRILKTFTGKVGLNLNAFALSSDGNTTNTSVDEYRESYLRIAVDLLELGKHVGPGTPAGSSRLKIDNTKASGAAVTTVFDTATAPAETGLPAVRLLFNNSAADTFIRAGKGGVGIAIDSPGEVSTFGDVTITDGALYLGQGCTLSDLLSRGGISTLQAAATVALLDIDNGVVTSEGDFTITNVNMTGGIFNSNHIKTGGDAITTANMNGGTLDGSKSGEPRTWGTVNLDEGTVVTDDAVVTITTLVQPAGAKTLQAS